MQQFIAGGSINRKSIGKYNSHCGSEFEIFGLISTTQLSFIVEFKRAHRSAILV